MYLMYMYMYVMHSDLILVLLYCFREMRKAWPFIDLSSSRDIPLCDVSDLCTLVDLILSVFEPTYTDSLKDKWSKTALQVTYMCTYSLLLGTCTCTICMPVNVHMYIDMQFLIACSYFYLSFIVGYIMFLTTVCQSIIPIV